MMQNLIAIACVNARRQFCNRGRLVACSARAADERVPASACDCERKGPMPWSYADRHTGSITNSDRARHRPCTTRFGGRNEPPKACRNRPKTIANRR